jgi:prolyl oligopeptidase
MEKIRDEVKFKGDLKAFNRFLLTDKQFYYDDPEALLTGYRDIAKRIDPELPRIFKTLPRLTYGIRAMPAYKAAESPGAYYDEGSLEAGRPGYFTANTTDLPGRPKWGMEALTLHEAVPGHHFQISIAKELRNVPEFRRFRGYTAFVEGWGLYAESLGPEIGLFKDPYSKYGQLTYEMWRSVRLVVDTGIHAKGWSREQAIAYFGEHMAKAKIETENEVDRYITWPGQALAYKVGQLKFRELREKATAELGASFDEREFHDQLLRHGALPMDVLEKTIGAWIDQEKMKTPKKLSKS